MAARTSAARSPRTSATSGRFDSCIGGIERINLNDVSGRARASVIQTDIDRDPVEPGAERGLTFEAAEAPVSANEYVLRQVAGIFVVAREAVAKLVDVPLVPSNEHIERRAISRQTGRDQARIIEFVPVLGRPHLSARVVRSGLASR